MRPIVLMGCCAAAALLASSGCRSVGIEARRYERAIDSLEHEDLGGSCFTNRAWLRLGASPDPAKDSAAANDAKSRCVATLSQHPDHPDRKQARDRVLRCMADAGWTLDKHADGSEENTICP